MKDQNMAKTQPISLLLFCSFLHIFQAKCSTSPLAPALYVFGDSLVDSGNNNNFPTSAKANYKPYGTDFSKGSTGRFTNGMTTVDFIAEFLRLPFVPPYNGLSVAQKSTTLTGINYASGSAGILTESGSKLGKNVPLKVQVESFNETVNKYLPQNFETKNELSDYLSESIFVVVIGGNDYINNYLKPEDYQSSRLYTPEQFSSLLLKQFKQHLQEIYNLGARKFVVFNMSPIGCIPAMTTNITIGCDNHINHMVSFYNKGFPSMLNKLSSTLSGSTFVQGNINPFPFLSQNPSPNGLISLSPCCVPDNVTHQCVKDEKPCKDRLTHIFWDAIHPTQVVNFELAFGCFYLPLPCSPINVFQLTQKKVEIASQQTHFSNLK